MLESFNQMMQNTTHPSEVAKTILQAVIADNPDFRYVVGKDAIMLLEARKNMPYLDFQQMIQKKYNSSVDGQTSIQEVFYSLCINYFLMLAPPKKLLSIFTTKSGRSSGIQCPDKGTLMPVTF